MLEYRCCLYNFNNQMIAEVYTKLYTQLIVFKGKLYYQNAEEFGERYDEIQPYSESELEIIWTA